MIYVLFFAVLFLGGGLCFLAYEVYMLIKWLKSEKVNAVISDVISNGEFLKYQYEVFIDGKTQQIWDSYIEVLNPFVAIFPKRKIGKKVTIRLDKQKMKIPQNPAVSVWYMVFAMLFMALGWVLVILIPVF